MHLGHARRDVSSFVQPGDAHADMMPTILYLETGNRLTEYQRMLRQQCMAVFLCYFMLIGMVW